MMKKILLLLCSLAGFSAAGAGLRLPEIVGDNMVLQQQSAARLWGWADPGARITVSASWSETPVEALTGGDGRWTVAVQTPEAGYSPRQITVSDGRVQLTLRNVLIGEVWFCSGQSNMEMPLDGFTSQPVENANADIARAGRYPGIRMATIARVKASVPQEEAAGGWKCCTSETAPRFSATAFYFARTLNETLDVPVGIVQCSWGGSKVEGWMPRSLLEQYPDIDLADTTSAKCVDYRRPMVMYNAMLYPLRHYTIRGFVWYQGCSNVGTHRTYAGRQAAMVGHWRELWGQGDLPFYFVEIAPYQYGEGDRGAFLREAQHRAAKLIPGSGIVSTADLVKPYEEHCIHPSRKREVGERLAYMALNRTYGRWGVACESPEYREMTLSDDGAALLAFDHTDGGLCFPGRIEGFEAAGADRVFHAAQAERISNQRIKVSLPGGSPVVAVRYCFRNWAPAQLWNCRGLPLLPFRTDDWEE